MTGTARSALAACIIGFAALSGTTFWPVAPFAQTAAKPDAAPKPVALTQAHIDGLIVALPELSKLGATTSDKPDPAMPTKLDQLAKKSGFANADELEQVADTFQAVVAGLDPDTKAYIGVIPLSNKRIQEIKADKEIPAKDKAAAVKALTEELPQTEPPKPSEDNIAIVVKNYDKLVEMAESADQ